MSGAVAGKLAEHVDEIRERYRNGESPKDIAKDFPAATYISVYFVCTGRSYPDSEAPPVQPAEREQKVGGCCDCGQRISWFWYSNRPRKVWLVRCATCAAALWARVLAGRVA